MSICEVLHGGDGASVGRCAAFLPIALYLHMIKLDPLALCKI